MSPVPPQFAGPVKDASAAGTDVTNADRGVRMRKTMALRILKAERRGTKVVPGRTGRKCG
jgi:hypothetical protein